MLKNGKSECSNTNAIKTKARSNQMEANNVYCLVVRIWMGEQQTHIDALVNKNLKHNGLGTLQM